MNFLPVIFLIIASAYCETEIQSSNERTDKKDKRGIGFNDLYSPVRHGHGFGANRYIPPYADGYDNLYGMSNIPNTGGYMNSGITGVQSIDAYGGNPGFYHSRNTYPGTYYNRFASSNTVPTFPLGGFGTVGISAGTYGTNGFDPDSYVRPGFGFGDFGAMQGYQGYFG